MRSAFLAAAIALAATPALADPLPLDTPINVDGVETVCTGIGDEAQSDTRWKDYPIRVETYNGAAQYVSGAHIMLRAKDGKPLTAVDCTGPWVLFKLDAGGEYIAAATLPSNAAAGERQARFTVPASGQQRVVIEFSQLPPNH